MFESEWGGEFQKEKDFFFKSGTEQKVEVSHLWWPGDLCDLNKKNSNSMTFQYFG